jgi:hypothetical protein
MEARGGFLRPLRFLGLGGGGGAEDPIAASIKDRKAKRHDLTGAKGASVSPQRPSALRSLR